MDGTRFSDLTRQRAFMRFWVARLFGTTGNQMLMVAIGWQSLTPNLLPPELLTRGLAFSSAGTQAAIIGGPALGGLLFVAGAAAVYAACAASFAVACVLVFLLRYPRGPRLTEPTSLRSILAGLAFVWQRKVLLGAVSLDLFAVLLGGATALLPMFAKDILFIGASNQLGEFESGATAALLGPVGSVVLGGLGTLLVAALWRRIFPAVARRDRLDRSA